MFMCHGWFYQQARAPLYHLPVAEQVVGSQGHCTMLLATYLLELLVDSEGEQ